MRAAARRAAGSRQAAPRRQACAGGLHARLPHASCCRRSGEGYLPAWLRAAHQRLCLPHPCLPPPRRAATPTDHRLLPRRIVLVRHAQSKGNVDPFLYEHTPDPSVPLVGAGNRCWAGAGPHRMCAQAGGRGLMRGGGGGVHSQLASCPKRGCDGQLGGQALAGVPDPSAPRPNRLTTRPRLPLPPPQTATGWQQAVEAGEKLKAAVEADGCPARLFFYTSPYLRCKQVRGSGGHPCRSRA